MEVPEGIDHDRFPRACYDVAQAPSRGPAYLVDGQIGTFDQSAGRVVLAPGFHPTLEVGASVAQAAQPFRDELRSVTLGAYRKDRQIRGKLV
jgi:hypothetical protein